MIVTNSDVYADRCISTRNHGEKPERPYFLGYNYRMTEAQAAFGLAQLETLDEKLKTQVDCAQIVRDNIPVCFRLLPRGNPRKRTRDTFPLR